VKNCLLDIHIIEKMVKESPDIFLKFLKEQTPLQGIGFAIETLKASRACVDIFGGSNKSEIYLQALSVLNQLSPASNEVERLSKEVNNFNNLFSEFEYLREKGGLNAIERDRQVPLFLLTAEILISSFANYSAALDYHKKHPLFGDFTTNKYGVNGFDIDKLAYVVESLCDYVGSLLHFFNYKKYPFENSGCTFLSEECRASLGYMNIFDKWNKVFQLYDSWCYVDCLLTEKESKKYVFQPNDKDQYLSKKVSTERFRHLRLSRGYQLASCASSHKNINHKNLILFPNGARSESEVAGGLLCAEFLGSEKLGDTILGVSINAWLRAFVMLAEAGEKFLRARNPDASLKLEEWCIISDKTEWVTLLEGGGITSHDSGIIIDNLIFDSDSKDLFDCPLVPFENKLLALPSFLAIIDPSQALLSNFINKDLDVSFKGNTFETYIRDLIRRSGLPYSKLSSNDGGENYEIDVAFILENDLYFIECKSFIQPTSFREYYSFLYKVFDASLQLNRSSGYFSANIGNVAKKLNLDNGWRPGKICKIILTKAMLGCSMIFNDCRVVDESSFVKFMTRDMPGVVIGKIKVPFEIDDFLGPITSKKLTNYIDNPFQIAWQRSNLKEFIRTMDLLHCKLDIIDYAKDNPMAIILDGKLKDET